MTYEEAIPFLKFMLEDVPLTKDEQEAFYCVFSALEKMPEYRELKKLRMPKKPKITFSIAELADGDYMKIKNYLCPTCSTYIHMFGECCPNNDCCQVILWEDEE